MIQRILALGAMSVGVMLGQVADKNWTPPKTPWGEPDLQGI
jgi:hypothetical protein